MTKIKPITDKDNSSLSLDKQWHLSTDQFETSLTEIEFALIRNYSAFSRWMDDCAACCHSSDEACNGMDYAVLNVIRMHNRAKGISEVARLMNRDDLSNLQYSIRKLTKAKLIEKMGTQGHKRGAKYQASEQGIIVTDKYAEIRRELLLPLVKAVHDNEKKFNDISTVLSLFSGIYDQAACIAASHRISKKQP